MFYQHAIQIDSLENLGYTADNTYEDNALVTTVNNTADRYMSAAPNADTAGSGVSTPSSTRMS